MKGLVLAATAALTLDAAAAETASERGFTDALRQNLAMQAGNEVATCLLKFDDVEAIGLYLTERISQVTDGVLLTAALQDHGDYMTVDYGADGTVETSVVIRKDVTSDEVRFVIEDQPELTQAVHVGALEMSNCKTVSAEEALAKFENRYPFDLQFDLSGKQ